MFRQMKDETNGKFIEKLFGTNVISFRKQLIKITQLNLRLIMKALILAAGLGTRLKPFTDNHPKALAPINGHSLLEINIRNLQRFGIFDVVVNVHHFSEQIIEVLQNENGFGSRFQISDETDEVLETGGGLKKAASFF